MGKDIIYMVTYVDDEYRKHLTFVRGFSAVRFLIDRFDNVHFEVTEKYARVEE
jgi:hypothetical protein